MGKAPIRNDIIYGGAATRNLPSVLLLTFQALLME